MGLFKNKQYETIEECIEDVNRGNLSISEEYSLFQTSQNEFYKAAKTKFEPLRFEFQNAYERMIKETNIGNLELADIESQLDDSNEPAFKKFKEKYAQTINAFCEIVGAEHVQDSSNLFNDCITLKEYAYFNCKNANDALESMAMTNLKLDVFSIDEKLRHELFKDTVREKMGYYNSMNSSIPTPRGEAQKYIDAYQFIIDSEQKIKDEINRINQFVDRIQSFKQTRKPTIEQYYEFKNKVATFGADDDSDHKIIDNIKEQVNNSSQSSSLQYELFEVFQKMCSVSMVLDLELEHVEDELDDISDSQLMQFKARHEQFVNDFCSEHNCVAKPHPYAPIGYCLLLKEYEKISPNTSEQELTKFVLQLTPSLQMNQSNSANNTNEDMQQLQEKIIEKEIIRIREFIDVVLANFYKLSPSAEDVQVLLNEHE